jgi:putative ABC transport system permease protein
MWKPSTSLPRGVRRLFSLPESPDRLMHDADEEMQFHLAMWKAEFRAQGLSEVEADAEARRRFGDPGEYRDYSARRASHKARWQRVTNWLAEWRHDVRLALRHFRKAPAFTATAVLTLALGIGANTAIFSVVHRLLIAPLPYPNGDRIVALKTMGRRGVVGALASMKADAPADPEPPMVRAWAARATRSFDMVAGVERMFLSLLPNEQQDTVSHAFMTANLLPMLGARPVLGRTFRPEEELEGADRVAMISYGWWQTAFGGGDALGKIVQYEGNPYTVVGVMPPGFAIPMSARLLDELTMPSPDVWLPTRLTNTETLFGRLKVGVSADDATRELQAITNTPEARGIGDPQVPFAPPDSVRVRAMRAQDFLAPREVRTIEVLFVAVGALLLIACANVANLLLVRAWTRRREFAVRMGLGAGRARLIRLALTESVLLAIIAGAFGVLIAREGLRVIIALRPIALDRLADVHIEPAVLFWTATISIITGVLFGGATAFFVGSQNVADLLRSEARTASGGSVTRRIRSSLIVLEIALSFALLVATGLLTRSFAALQETPIGFDSHNLVSVDVFIPPVIARAGRTAEVRDEVLRRLRQMPGATDAAFGTLPTAGYRNGLKLIMAGDDGEKAIGISQLQVTWVTEDYFGTSRIKLVAGRVARSAPSDTAPTTQLYSLSQEIVVSRGLARRIAPDGNAVGVRVRPMPGMPRGRPSTAPLPPPINTWSTIVGIVDDAHLPGPRGDLDSYQLYMVPLRRTPSSTFVVRFASVPPNVESLLRKTIQRAIPTLIVRRARVADDYLREALAPTRFTLALLGAFSFVALVLSVVGLYGSIAYTVSQRTREIGIRIALGASSNAVTRLVVGDGVRLVVVGLVIGVATSAASTRTLASLLYAVSPGDPATFVAIAVMVTAIALAASYVPARRAVRIDPADALRAD